MFLLIFFVLPTSSHFHIIVQWLDYGDQTTISPSSHPEDEWFLFLKKEALKYQYVA